MSFTNPLYEGDGYLPRRYATKLAAGTAARMVKSAEARANRADGLERQARWLGARGLAALIGRFFSWLERSAREARRREIERYLAQSTDAVDLEHRMKALERRGELFS